MSTGNTTEAEIIAQASFDFHASCFTYSILALFSYDFLITLSQEIKFVWGHKFTGATVIYLLNRYIIVLYLVLNYVPLSCSQLCDCRPHGRHTRMCGIFCCRCIFCTPCVCHSGSVDVMGIGCACPGLGPVCDKHLQLLA
ncbi:hypothetical protein B0H21DRAFT_486690 [Amylocystis lapponica]|nr:hypothetical protein B0H21DRAFT_486690 [Amylocystis lapponica]